MQFKIEGGTALATALGQLSARVSKRIQLEALHEVAEPMRAAMARRAPSDSGRLRSHMLIRTSRGQDAQETAVAIGPARGTYYGSFQELGTKDHPAQPFARPAFDETVERTTRELGAVLWRELAGRGIQRPSVTVDMPVQGEEV